jgi:hypothetical protein
MRSAKISVAHEERKKNQAVDDCLHLHCPSRYLSRGASTFSQASAFAGYRQAI